MFGLSEAYTETHKQENVKARSNDTPRWQLEAYLGIVFPERLLEPLNVIDPPTFRDDGEGWRGLINVGEVRKVHYHVGRPVRDSAFSLF